MKKPKVGIIISTYSQGLLLNENILSIKKLTSYKNYKIFLVDDSGNGSIGKDIKERFNDVDVTINEKSLGFSKSYNIGIKRALSTYNPDYLLILNDDTEMISNWWLGDMVNIAENRKYAGIFGCKILYEDGKLQNLGGYVKKWRIELDSREDENPFEVDHVMGAFMFIRKDVIKTIDLLDEGFTPYLLEDTDYCLRAKRFGWKIISVPYVRIIHKKSQTLNTINDEKRLFVRLKNELKFSRRHLKGIDKFIRIFLYLPLISVFVTRKNLDELKTNKFSIRRNPLMKLWIWFNIFFPKKYKEFLDN